MSEAAEAAVPADEVQTETPTPPASEAEAPVVPENRESIKTKAKESAERLGRALFRRKLTEKDDQLLTGSQRAVKTFLRLQEETQAQEGEPTSYINPDKPKGIELNGKPIIVEKDGRQLTLLSITGQVNKDGVAMALCTYRQGQGSPSTPELIPWNDIVNAQIISEQQEFSQMFQGDEQAVFNYYVAQITGGDLATQATEQFLGDKNLNTSVNTILKLAKANGFITREDVLAFIKVRTKQLIDPTTGREMTPDEVEQMGKLADMKTAVGEEIILTGEALATIVLNNADATPEQLDQGVKLTNDDLEVASKRISEIDARLAQNPPQDEKDKLIAEKSQQEAQKQRLEFKIKELQGYRELLNLTEGNSVQDVLHQYTHGVENGTIPLKTAQAIAEGISKGDIGPLVDELIAEAEKPKDGESEEKAKERQEKVGKIKLLRKGAQGIGLLALIAMVATTMATTQVLKS